MLLLALANLLTKGRIKYGVTESVRVRVSNNIKYILYFICVLHFIHLHSVGGATVVRTEGNIISCTTYRARTLNVTCFRAVSTVHVRTVRNYVPCANTLNVTYIFPLHTVCSHGA